MLVIGVDVGGTNTDAVCVRGSTVLTRSKVPTSPDVTTGMRGALSNVIEEVKRILGCEAANISRVNIGTTHFVNAVIQRRGLTPVAVIRLCGPSSRILPPFANFPPDLREILCASVHLVNGGYEFNGDEITPLDEEELIGCIQTIRTNGINNVVVCGIFSPVKPAQELKVAELVAVHHPQASVTLSHQVGQPSILERENASILNESLKPLCIKTVSKFAGTLAELGLMCPFYLTQNDGTVTSAEQAMKFPAHTFSSGPTNSMRGAAQLSGIQNCIVIDVGGTSSDVGVLQNGFPKEASTKVKVGGVDTNFQMPDVICEGLGGGSRVRYKEEGGHITSVTIGPDSVGYLLTTESRVFGGATLTATDIAVAAGMVTIGDPALVDDLPAELIQKALNEIRNLLENLIDQVKLSADDIPVIVVGGGSILIDETQGLRGTSQVIKCAFYEVANAIGATRSQVSGLRDTVVSLESKTRDDAVEEAKQQAVEIAVGNSAQSDSIQITEVSVIPLAYLTGQACRVRVKAVGDLALDSPLNQATLTVLPEQTQSSVPSYSPVDLSEVSVKSEVAVEQQDIVRTVPVPPSDWVVDPDSGEWLLSEFDVECIAIGAGILGCGGGGDPAIGRLIVLRTLSEGGRIRVIAPERLGTSPHLKGSVVPVGFMGAPGVIIEKLQSGNETPQAVQCLQQVLNAGQDNYVPATIEGVPVKEANGVKYIDDYPTAVQPDQPSNKAGSTVKVVAVMPVEIGGSNAMEPLSLSSKLDLPVVDCDLMGRAFPELQMVLSAINGCKLCPSVLVDDKGRRAVSFSAADCKQLENHFRGVVVEMGCQGALAFAPLDPGEIMNNSVHYSISRACRLGRAVLRARQEKTSPIDAILTHENGRLLISGKISDVIRETREGFTRGKIKLDGTGQYCGELVEVEFQNENLVAHRINQRLDEVLATTPDLITIIDAEEGHPISTEELRYGLRVAVLSLPCSPVFRTPEALARVGPRAFGYDYDFVPVADYVSHAPIPTRPGVEAENKK